MPVILEGVPQSVVSQWGQDTFDHLDAIRQSQNAHPGAERLCHMCPGHIIHTAKQAEPHWRHTVMDYRHLTKAELATHDGLRLHDDQERFVDGFSFQSLMINSPAYLQWLMQRFRSAGGLFEQRRVESLASCGSSDDAAPVLVVNCTGLAAGKLCADESIYPVRGQAVRVTAPSVDRFLVIESGKHSLSYILPRNPHHADGQVVLGGTIEPNNWSDKNDPQQVAQILKRCSQFVPALRQPEVQQSAQPWAGLRPGRSAEAGGVRLEIDQKHPWLIHNYGHGGSGMTLHWGCARYVLRLALEVQQASVAKL